LLRINSDFVRDDSVIAKNEGGMAPSRRKNTVQVEKLSRHRHHCLANSRQPGPAANVFGCSISTPSGFH
jgi:hypothetical protein